MPSTPLMSTKFTPSDDDFDLFLAQNSPLLNNSPLLSENTPLINSSSTFSNNAPLSGSSTFKLTQSGCQDLSLPSNRELYHNYIHRIELNAPSTGTPLIFASIESLSAQSCLQVNILEVTNSYFTIHVFGAGKTDWMNAPGKFRLHWICAAQVASDDDSTEIFTQYGSEPMLYSTARQKLQISIEYKERETIPLFLPSVVSHSQDLCFNAVVRHVSKKRAVVDVFLLNSKMTGNDVMIDVNYVLMDATHNNLENDKMESCVVGKNEEESEILTHYVKFETSFVFSYKENEKDELVPAVIVAPKLDPSLEPSQDECVVACVTEVNSKGFTVLLKKIGSTNGWDSLTGITFCAQYAPKNHLQVITRQEIPAPSAHDEVINERTKFLDAHKDTGFVDDKHPFHGIEIHEDLLSSLKKRDPSEQEAEALAETKSFLLDFVKETEQEEEKFLAQYEKPSPVDAQEQDWEEEPLRDDHAEQQPSTQEHAEPLHHNEPSPLNLDEEEEFEKYFGEMEISKPPQQLLQYPQKQHQAAPPQQQVPSQNVSPTQGRVLPPPPILKKRVPPPVSSNVKQSITQRAPPPQQQFYPGPSTTLQQQPPQQYMQMAQPPQQQFVQYPPQQYGQPQQQQYYPQQQPIYPTLGSSQHQQHYHQQSIIPQSSAYTPQPPPQVQPVYVQQQQYASYPQVAQPQQQPQSNYAPPQFQQQPQPRILSPVDQLMHKISQEADETKRMTLMMSTLTSQRNIYRIENVMSMLRSLSTFQNKLQVLQTIIDLQQHFLSQYDVHQIVQLFQTDQQRAHALQAMFRGKAPGPRVESKVVLVVLELFSQNARMEMLRMMAQSVSDPQNATQLVYRFPLVADQKQVRQMFGLDVVTGKGKKKR